MFRPTRRVRSDVAALAVVAALLGACGTAPSGIAAVVNGVQIPETVLQEVVAQERAALQERGVTGTEQLAQLRAAQRTQLTNEIRRAILEQEAEVRGLVVTQEREDELWDQQTAAFVSEEEIQLALDEAGLTEQDVRDVLRQQEVTRLLQEEVRAQITVSDEDVQRQYDALGDQWLTRGASHIMLDDPAAADEVAALLVDDPDAFEDLAEQRSIDPGSAPLGGLLGDQPRGVYPPSFDDAIWNTPVGEIVGPVEVVIEDRTSYHLVRIDNETLTTLDQVRDQLEQQLRGSQFPELYGAFEAELWASAEVVLDRRFGKWDTTLGEVVLQDPLGL